jgi:ubiquinone/menaquinone biosynthesis C-methylase UbiE
VTAGRTPFDYGAWRESALGRITERLERGVIFELAGPLAGLEVLDVGCGDGAYAVALATQGARVTGVDAWLTVLRAAALRAQNSPTSLALVASDASSLPFESDSFELVVAVTALCFMKSPRAALGEIARVLRPGGRVVLGELGRASTWAAWRRLRAWFGNATWRGTTFWTATDLRRLARSAGLVPGEIRGAAFYPPVGAAAAVLAPLDPALGRRTTLGAAFLAIEARKP